MKSSIFWCYLLVALSVNLFSCSTSRPRRGLINENHCNDCNVVLISIDSLRFDHLSVYGYERNTSPVLDEFSKGASVFENFFASSYLTPISEGSVHSGLYPENNGITDFDKMAASDVVPLAKILREKGYRTGAFGNSPEFSREAAEGIFDSFSNGFEEYQVVGRYENRRRIQMKPIEKFIKNFSQEPFFLWIPMGTVHAPFGYQLPNHFARLDYAGPLKSLSHFGNLQFLYKNKLYDLFSPKYAFRLFIAEKLYDGPMIMLPGLEGVKEWPIQLTESDTQYLVDNYDNGIKAADQEFGRILSILKEQNLLSNTVIIFQSEHGESLGDHGYFAHYDIWEETTHVPLIFYSPILRPVRFDGLISGVDILPSILDHLNVSFDKYPFDGKSFFAYSGAGATLKKIRDEVFLTRSPLWETVLRLNRQESLFDRFGAINRDVEFKDYAIRTQTHKLFHRLARFAEEEFSCWAYISGERYLHEEFEFYDLKKDSRENYPLPVNSRLSRGLKEKLLAFEALLKKTKRNTSRKGVKQDYR